jgi:uncharacterized protein
MEMMDEVSEIAKTVRLLLSDAEGGHDWFHIERVMKNALNIYEHEKNGDVIVIQLAALLHDIADAKFHDGDERIGPARARTIMLEHRVPEEKIYEVIRIIENMSYRSSFSEQTYTSVELDILKDADKLDAIGAIGIARAFSYGGFRNRQIYNPELQPLETLTKESYVKNNGPTINHFYEKLLKLKDMMKTQTGKELAIERHHFMCSFLDQFYKEVH